MPVATGRVVGFGHEAAPSKGSRVIYRIGGRAGQKKDYASQEEESLINPTVSVACLLSSRKPFGDCLSPGTGDVIACIASLVHKALLY